ncbi:hypothetical protein SCLCIDRAFT_1211751 [Scleroderma citrinum Foug A]|uniref:Uncharacterized protein n=1 Tax=Scleroderma citrinum Foug A TaxID=1036808 RepID=A0A0C3DYZ1_9AGAM|nr:hypothetical protein SCLCIDRAFT_1211751 [Scleroderma citrinum Foug A]
MADELQIDCHLTSHGQGASIREGFVRLVWPYDQGHELLCDKERTRVLKVSLPYPFSYQYSMAGKHI